MESAAVLSSFHGAMRTVHPGHCFTENPAMVTINRISLKTASFSGVLFAAQALKSTPAKRTSFHPYVKASESSSSVTFDASSSGKTLQGTLENKHNQKATFPSGFEALVLDVCDETNIAELKVKVGDFELLLKRDIGFPEASASTASHIVSPNTAPPIPSEPMSESDPAPQPASPPPKPSSAPSNQFAYVSSLKESKLATLEASGSSGYALVSSPTVGSYRSGRTVKGKKQPPNCKEGDVIKEGQVIGYLDQFGNELPIKSDVAGEVLKVLFKDGEPVGYGDPMVAILPSFRGIK